MARAPPLMGIGSINVDNQTQERTLAVNRFVVDVVTPEPMSRREYQRRSGELNDWVQAVGTDDVQEKDANQSFHHGHTHVSTRNEACNTCIMLASDERQ